LILAGQGNPSPARIRFIRKSMGMNGHEWDDVPIAVEIEVAVPSPVMA